MLLLNLILLIWVNLIKMTIKFMSLNSLRFVQLRQPRSRALPSSSAAPRGELVRIAPGLRGADRGAGQSEGNQERGLAGAALHLHHMQGKNELKLLMYVQLKGQYYVLQHKKFCEQACC